MITTQGFTCSLAKVTADALNRESGRIYTATLVEHYRVYRHTGHWVSPRGDQRLSDRVTGETILHAHSRDAAQEAFPKACKTARVNQKGGLNAHFPHRIKRWKRIQRRKNRFLAQQKRRKRDIEHKVSRAVVDWAVAQQVGKLAVGDVRDIADRVDRGKQFNQKIANWTHGKLRTYIAYKAAAKGIAVELVNEAYTSQTCPNCGERHKPKGRVYRCPACGFVSHRDAVGAANIRSVCLYGTPGKSPPGQVKYRLPFTKGRRSRPGTAHVARLTSREAAVL